MAWWSDLGAWIGTLGDWVLGLTDSAWVYPALTSMAMIDGFFPPVPSESLVIALASLSVSDGSPTLWLVALAAAIGAFSGDQIAYSIGKRVGIARRRFAQGARFQRTLAWAERGIRERGAVLIIAARYIPVGRVAVNMTAGGLRYPRGRFTALAAIAALSWSVYTVVLGVGAGLWFSHSPWIGVAVGVAGGILIGLAADPLLAWIGRRLGWQSLAELPTSKTPRPEDPDPSTSHAEVSGVPAPADPDRR